MSRFTQPNCRPRQEGPPRLAPGRLRWAVRGNFPDTGESRGDLCDGIWWPPSRGPPSDLIVPSHTVPQVRWQRTSIAPYRTWKSQRTGTVDREQTASAGQSWRLRPGLSSRLFGVWRRSRAPFAPPWTVFAPPLRPLLGDDDGGWTNVAPKEKARFHGPL